MNLIFKGKKPSSKNIKFSVKGNNDTETLVLILAAEQDDVDLTEYKPYIKMVSPNGKFCDKDPNVEVLTEDGVMTLLYQITRKVTAHNVLSFQLQFEKEDGGDVKVWQTEMFSVTFAGSIHADKIIQNTKPTLIQDITARLEKLEKNGGGGGSAAGGYEVIDMEFAPVPENDPGIYKFVTEMNSNGIDVNGYYGTWKFPLKLDSAPKLGDRFIFTAESPEYEQNDTKKRDKYEFIYEVGNVEHDKINKNEMREPLTREYEYARADLYMVAEPSLIKLSSDGYSQGNYMYANKELVTNISFGMPVVSLIWNVDDIFEAMQEMGLPEENIQDVKAEFGTEDAIILKVNCSTSDYPKSSSPTWNYEGTASVSSGVDGYKTVIGQCYTQYGSEHILQFVGFPFSSFGHTYAYGGLYTVKNTKYLKKLDI